MAAASTTTWADIQRLAADLQRVQLAETSNRLTEANCVEVVSMLVSMGLVDLVVSTDGKEYVTRKHLLTECANECLAAGGRVALTELAAQLNVDLDHVNTAVNQLLKEHHQQQQEEAGEPTGKEEGGAEFVVCAGELLHRSFIDDLCARLNARLGEQGHLSMLQLTRHWELPTELLSQHVLPEMGTHSGAKIAAIRFEDQLCTVNYLNILRGKLLAVLIALTKPIPLATIHSHLGIGQSLFFKLWDELAEQGRLPGKLLGSKNSLKSLYLPELHERLAKQYIRQRLAEDHFIEIALLKRLSITVEPGAFFRELLPEKDYQDLIFWPSVVLSESKLWKDCDSLAENLLQSSHFCLLEDILPSQFNFLREDDYAKVVERLQKHCNGANLRATSDCVFEHPQLLDSWMKAVEDFVKEKAKNDAPELRKAQLSSALAKHQQKGGQQRKETEKGDEWETDNSRAGKKGNKGRKGGANAGPGKRHAKEEPERQNDPLSLAQISSRELFAELKRTFPDDWHLPSSLEQEMEEDFQMAANNLYRSAVSEAWQLVDSGEQQEQRRIYEQKLAKIGDFYTSICLFERGANIFEDSLRNDLLAHLLRTLCTELAQSLLRVMADPNAQTAADEPQSPTTLSIRQRDQLIGSLESAEMQRAARELFDCLDTLEHFHEGAQKLGAIAGLMLRQPDKKDRTEHLSVLGDALGTQLADCNDPPTALLLAVLLSLHRFHGVAVHASGKFVTPLIAFLSSKPLLGRSSADADAEQKKFPEELASLLASTQQLVVASIKKKGQPNEQMEQQLIGQVKQLKAFFADATNS